MVVMPAMRLVRCPGWCAVVQRRASAVAQGISDAMFVTVRVPDIPGGALKCPKEHVVQIETPLWCRLSNGPRKM